MRLFLLIVGSFVVVATRYLSELEVECSIIAILTEKRAESEDCNLKTLMVSPWNYSRSSSTKTSMKRDVKKLHIRYCEPDEQCRIDGKRTCLCSDRLVCEPSNSIYSCVPFKFFRL